MTTATISEAARLLCVHRTVHNGTRNCVGPACMAWRWHKAPSRRTIECRGKDASATVAPPRPGNVPMGWQFVPASDGDPALWVESDREFAERCTGYCGLAGDPVHDGPGV